MGGNGYKMKMNKIFIIGLALLVLMSLSVSATITVDYPVSSSFLTTNNELFRATLSALGSGSGNVSGWNISYRSGDTGDWTFLLANTTNNNMQNNQTLLIDIVDFSAVATGNNYDINITTFNNSGVGESTIVDDVDVDNTAPTNLESFSSTFTYVRVGSETSTDCRQATDSVDTSLNWSIKLLNQDNVLVRVYATSTASFNDGDFSTVGDYTLNCGVKDASGNSANGTLNLFVKGSKDTFDNINQAQTVGSSGTVSTGKESSDSNNKALMLLLLSGALLILIAIVLYVRKK